MKTSFNSQKHGAISNQGESNVGYSSLFTKIELQTPQKCRHWHCYLHRRLLLLSQKVTYIICVYTISTIINGEHVRSKGGRCAVWRRAPRKCFDLSYSTHILSIHVKCYDATLQTTILSNYHTTIPHYRDDTTRSNRQ